MTKRYILALFLFFILIISTYFIGTNIETIEFVKEDYTSVNSNSNYAVKEIKEEGDTFKISGYIPQTNYKDLNEKIQNIVDNYIKEFKSDISDIKPISGDSKFVLEFTFDSYEHENYISYVIHEYVNMGGAHPNMYMLTISYDIKNKKVITIEDLVKMNPKILDILSKYTHEKLKENSIIKEVNDPDMLTSGTKPTTENFKRFAFDKNGLIIFFETYQVAPYVAGDFSVTVPYSNLGIKIN